MSYSIEGLNYQEKYRCWEGNITVICDSSLFGKDEISLPIYINSREELTKEEYNTICYLKENFNLIYENILKGILKWQSTGVKFEIFNNETSEFEPIVFKNINDIHQYIGMPKLQIIHGYVKNDFSYFAVNFFDDCLISIEHGLSALFYKEDLIDINSSDAETIIDLLSYYEEDCSLWQKNFWLVKLNTKFNDLSDKSTIREKWLL